MLIQILFWLAVFVCMLNGIMLIVYHEATGDLERGVVIFRIHDDLRSIERNKQS
jgi:hypothetical protein